MNYKVIYFTPPDDTEPIVMIVPKRRAKQKGIFQKTYRRFEARGWSIQEIKQKEKKYEKKSIHPQTGERV